MTEKEKKNVRYSNTTNYAYGKYAYDFTSSNFATIYGTTVTQEVKWQRRNVYTIGLKASPRPNERITVGKLRIDYIVTSVFGVERTTGKMLYKIKRADLGEMHEGVDGLNSKVGAKVYFNSRLRGGDFSEILKDMK